jgi:hypothetical protein
VAIRYQAGFTFGATIPEVRMRVTEATGSVDFDVWFSSAGQGYADADGGADTVFSAATKRSAHEGFFPVLPEYGAFSNSLQQLLDEASDNDGNGWTYDVTYSTTTHRYTISADGGNIALAFAVHGTAGLAMRNLLGFSGDSSSAASHSSNARPYYLVLPYLSDKSKVSGDYEQGSLIRGAIAGDGQHYSVGPATLPTLSDWTQEFEYAAGAAIATVGTAVFTADATSTVPWSWQHFYQHCRAREPFLVVDDNESTVHFLRPDAAHFQPARRQTDWNMFDMPLKTYLRGRL